MKLKNTEDALDAFAKEAVRYAQLNLGTIRTLRYTTRPIRSNSVASGTLKKSLRYYRTDTRFEFTADPPADGYADRVEYGTDPGTVVPVEKLEDWIRRKPVKMRDKEGRFIKSTDAAVKSAAMRFVTAIYERGIPGTFFYSRGIEQALDRSTKKIETALLKDLEINLL